MGSMLELWHDIAIWSAVDIDFSNACIILRILAYNLRNAWNFDVKYFLCSF